MIDYKAKLYAHLANYKTQRLGISQQGTWRDSKGEVHSYGHILPDGLEYLNLLEPIRAEMQVYLVAHPDIKLHKDFKHLNSSQAFAFNLFFPYFSAGASGARALSGALGLDMDVPSEGWRFEEIQDENTNVDVVWQSQTGQKVFCEVKLSEAEFGQAKNDQRHQDKLRDIYFPRLHGLVSPDLLERKTFFAHYQLLRNVSLLHGNADSQLVILLPRANEALKPQLSSVLDGVRPDHQHRIHVVHIEDALNSLCANKSLAQPLRVHASALKEKYVPVETV
jgi:hypothetical protein